MKIKYYNNKFMIYQESLEIGGNKNYRIHTIINYFNNLNIIYKTIYPIYLIINLADGNTYNFNVPIFAFNKNYKYK